MSCLIAGDSIAVGVAEQLPVCAVRAKVGITSKMFKCTYVATLPHADSTVISLGSNDWGNSYDTLRQIRSNIKGAVYWIKPSKPCDAVAKVAKEYGDVVLHIPQVSRDRVHPTSKGYKKLASEIIKYGITKEK